MIAFMLLRTIFLIGILSCYSLGMFRLINQFFGERYQSYLQDELNRKPHMKTILKQHDKATVLSSSTPLVNKPIHPSDILIEKFNVDTCRKIDRFYEITSARNVFCQGVDKTIVVTFNEDNDNKLLLNGSHYYYKKTDPSSDKNVLLKYEHINESNDDNIKKIQLKKMLSITDEKRKNERHKFYNHVKNEGKIKNYDHQECYGSTEEDKCSINQGTK